MHQKQRVRTCCWRGHRVGIMHCESCCTGEVWFAAMVSKFEGALCAFELILCRAVHNTEGCALCTLNRSEGVSADKGGSTARHTCQPHYGITLGYSQEQCVCQKMNWVLPDNLWSSSNVLYVSEDSWSEDGLGKGVCL